MNNQLRNSIPMKNGTLMAGADQSAVVSMTADRRLACQNQLLAMIPHHQAGGLFESLELISVRSGQIFMEIDRRPDFVYFPIDAVVSLVSLAWDGSLAEASLVAREGVIGAAVFLGDGVSNLQAIVQRGGTVYRIRISALQGAFDASAHVRRVLLRYVQAMTAQLAQAVLCNRHHTVQQRLCRWLLAMQDRVSSNELWMTQETMANALGVRRSGVTEAAGELQRMGAIRYSRGAIQILSRASLEMQTCECYGVVRREFERLFPVSPAGAELLPPSMGHLHVNSPVNAPVNSRGHSQDRAKKGLHHSPGRIDGMGFAGLGD